ncbi:MAG: peptidoglycan-binding domain-containing protein [Brevirhabdus sp.]
MWTILRKTTMLCAVALAAGCAPEAGDVARAPGLESDVPLRPEGAAEGTCWHRDVTPAVIETQTRHVIVQPAQMDSEGRVISPAVWRTERAPRIVQERREQWIETPCPAIVTGEFVMSLQRALAARGVYRGTPNGTLDRSTKRAIRAFQAARGLDSAVLSLDSARALGLVVVDLGQT